MFDKPTDCGDVRSSLSEVSAGRQSVFKKCSGIAGKLFIETSMYVVMD